MIESSKATSIGSRFRQWFRLATSKAVVKRALFYAVVVGLILNAINHGPNLVCGRMDGICLVQMMMTACVPYAVSTLSSVQALLQKGDCGPSVAGQV